MYNRAFLPLVLSFLIALCPMYRTPKAQAPAQTAPSADGVAIKKIMAAQVVAWNKGDLNGFMQGYWNNDSMTFINKNGPTYGWQPVLDHYKKTYPDKASQGELQFDHLILKSLSPHYYFVIGAWHIHKQTGDVGGQFTLLFRKIQGAWKIIVDHTS